MGQSGGNSGADIQGMSMTTGALTMATDAEMGLLFASKYETEVNVEASDGRQRFHSVGALMTVAALVVAYDIVSLLFAR